MAKIDQVEIAQIDIAPKVKRTDAIQSFVTQETVMVTVRCDDGSAGTGYTYTIGTGGSSIVALLNDHLVPRLIGRDPQQYEAIWRDLFFHTHATAVGAITSLALAAIDTALWDRNARAAGLPLWRLAGGAQARVPVYTTEGGWLHIEPAQLVEQTLAAKADQSFTTAEAIRRARQYAPLDLAWFEEPMPAEHVRGHAQLLASTSVPIAVGESMYHPSQFAEYIQQGACSIVQADVARVGGITPWLKIAHLAEAHNIAMCPHFLMELHVSLCAAVPNARWVEYIPQLDDLTTSRLRIEGGHAVAPETPGLGIEWNADQLKARRKFAPIVVRG
jgi:L-alanine-DL-glutamate epimerase-like enolase superfamily enzyme